MSTQATGMIENKSWDEQPAIDASGGARVARGRMVEIFKGGIEGEGLVEALITYRLDGSAAVIGFERVVGHVGDRPGSFVLQFAGSLANNTADVTWVVVPGSGTEQLSTLAGKGGYTWDGHVVEYVLDYTCEPD